MRWHKPTTYRHVSICEYPQRRNVGDNRSKLLSYGIYSVVFFYRTNIFGALNVADEREEVSKLV